MATFITLINFTDQGIRNIKGSPDRAIAFRALCKKLGVTVQSMYWTVGAYDMVMIADGSEEALTTALWSLGSLGNVRTQSLRAFSEQEMTKMLADMV